MTAAWPERFKGWSERNPLLAGLTVCIAIVSTLVTAWGLSRSAYEWVNTTFRWRQIAYAELNDLRVGTSLRRVDVLLGDPVTASTIKQSGFREHVYMRRDHWVQVITTQDETVAAFVVTACDDDFQPTFRMPQPGGLGIVTLNETRLNAVLSSPDGLDYLVPASRAGYFEEWQEGYGVTNNLSYSYGIAGACEPRTEPVHGQEVLYPLTWRESKLLRGEQVVREEYRERVYAWRATAYINSWGVCDSTCDPSVPPLQGAEYGVDQDQAFRLGEGD